MEMFAPSYLALGGITVILALWAYIILIRLTSRRLPLPPGPKGLPFIGTFFNMPKGNLWLVYDEWFKLYGTSSLAIKDATRA
jgi:hypothetical protein